MDHDDTSPTQGVAKRQLRHLVVPAPAVHEFNRGVDVIHVTGLALLQGSE
jgi:hypothetical protein